MMPSRIRSLGNMLKTIFLRIEHMHTRIERLSKDYHVVHFRRRTGFVILDEDRAMVEG